MSSKKDKLSTKPLNLKTQAIHEAIQKKVLEMYGDYGTAAIKAGFSGIKITFCLSNNKSIMFNSSIK